MESKKEDVEKTRAVDEAQAPEPATPIEPEKTVPAADKPNKFKRILTAYWRKKFLTVPLTVVVLVAIILAVPATRYPVLGLFLKKDFTVQVLDAASKKPVSKAQVSLGDVVAQTDAKGNVKFHAPVGKTTLDVVKKYYKSNSAGVLVDLAQKNGPFKIYIKATGRQVPVTVVNKISGKPVAGAVIAAADTEAKTDKDGKATIVLPADKQTVAVKITAAGMNDLGGTLQVKEQVVPENTFRLVPNGKVYFLSKLSGKIDVVKTNLDGSDRQTVLAATGKEDQTDTILLASRDWKYLALKSKRDGGEFAKLFLIDATNDKVTTMDEGDADFVAIGWAEHRFVYQVNRKVDKYWQDKAQALKTYNAESDKLTTIDESNSDIGNDNDYAYNYFGSAFVIGNELIYNKNWNASYYYSSTSRLKGKQISLVSAQVDGSGKKTIKDFPIPAGYESNYALQLSLYEPQGVYIQVPPEIGSSKSTYYEYEGGKLEPKPDTTDQDFNSPYPTYLASPSGKQTFWAEPRDGKSTLFVGDIDGQNGKQVASLSEYTVYGWYSDTYLLVSKESSELYILPVTGGTPVKVTDYHKPDYNFRGYGGGYGGL